MVSAICLKCNTEFFTYPSVIKKGRKYCSHTCAASGETNPRYKGGLEVITKTCPVCEKEFQVTKYETWWRPAIYCSKSCNFAAQRTGQKPKTIHGYIYIHVPNHPNANVDGFVAQHRLFIEEQVGRYLTPVEVVHHKDRVRNNNDLSNLQLCTNQDEHEAIHRKWKSENMKRIRSERFWSSRKPKQ